MSKIPPETWANLQFDFNASLQIAKYAENISEIWGQISESSQPSTLRLTLDKEVIWIIWLFDSVPYFTPLTEHDYWVLLAMQDEKCFAEICEGLLEWYDEAEAVNYVAGLMRQWVDMGLFSSISVAAEAAT
jgi:hypothetical protein